MVTVDRREQSLQDFAGTAQAFDANQLGSLAVGTDFKNLQNIVPGLHITQQEGKTEVFMRGIGSSDSDFSSDPSVATHYNGVYLARPRSFGPMFFDVQRVEVNKGPQGTLRGRNATGGTINIISQQPDFDDTYGSVQVGQGNFNSKTQEAVFNIPFGDVFAVRAAVFTETHDSYYSNAYGNAVSAPGEVDTTAFRLSAKLDLGDFSGNVILHGVDDKGTGYPGAFTGRSLSAGYDINDLDDPFNQYFRSEGEMTNEIFGMATTLTYDLANITLEYNGAYRAYDFSNRNASRDWQLGMAYPGSEAEANYEAYYENDFPINGQINAFPERKLWNDTFFQAEKSESFLHELRIFNDSAERFSWTAGLFLYSETFDYVSWDVGNGYFGDCDWWKEGTLCGWQDGLGGASRGDDSTVNSTALYADGSFDITDTLRIKGGIRFTKDKKVANDSNVKYQFIVDEGAFDEFGLVINTQTNPYNTGLHLTTPGFELTAPGARGPQSPVICDGVWSAAEINQTHCAAGVDPLNYFLAGIESFGNNDNWNEFLTRHRDQIDVVARSDFYSDPDKSQSGEAGENRTIFAQGVSEQDYVDWRLGLEYDITDQSLLYTMLSTGTRTGGVNRPIVLPSTGQSLARTWEPEKLTVLEIGHKLETHIGKYPTRINSAFFYYDYKDKVVQNLVNACAESGSTCSFVFTDNAADATVMGLEVEANTLFGMGFEAKAHLVLLDSEFKNSELVDSRTGKSGISVDGNKLANTSDVNLNLSIQQTIDMDKWGFTEIRWAFHANYRSQYFLTAYNNTGYDINDSGQQITVPLESLAPNNNTALADTGGAANGNFFNDEVPGFVQLNTSVGARIGDNVNVNLFANNLTNIAYSGKGFINDSVNIRYLNTPRTVGASIKVDF